MTLQTEQREGSGSSREAAPLIDWIRAILARRDLTVAAPSDDRAAAIGMLLDALSQEFAEYLEVVVGARDAAGRNAAQLRSVVQATHEQDGLTHATAKAATEASDGAVRMEAAATDLHEFSGQAATLVSDAATNLATIEAALDELGHSLAGSDSPLEEMRKSTAGVAAFLLTLGRLSRHAQLLAVNASIESAHLAEAGARFAIVADEVRKLSVSTAQSKVEVSQIVGDLRKSTQHIAASTTASKESTHTASKEILGAASSLARTGRGIDEFQGMVANVADVAGTQSMALASISASVEQIAHHAREAAAASSAAAKLELDALLENAGAKARRWKLRDGSLSGSSDGSAFARWIEAVTIGGDAFAPADVDADPGEAPLIGEVRTLIQRVNAEQREILGDVVQVAVAVSRNGFAWRSISQSLEQLTSEIALVRETVAESVSGARASVELATGMNVLTDAIRDQYDRALTLLEGALGRISRTTASVAEIGDSVQDMRAAANRADQIMGLIETLSSETDLLSLNAAIEAAHAGEQGLGFSVIAEEIRTLARSTNESTTSVSALVSKIARVSTQLQTSIAGAAAGMNDVVVSADGTRSAIGTLRSSLESAVGRAAEVATIARDQTRALDGVLLNINRCAAAFDSNSAGATDKGRLELATLGARAHEIAARRPLGTTIERVRRLTESLCVRLEAAFEDALVMGRISCEQLFSLSYRAIEGSEIANLARLFDTSLVPVTGFTPPKYATPWDAEIDEALIAVLTQGWEEANAAEISPIAIFVSDLNGLFYAYPSQKIAAWTNDFAVDNAGNRIKRMFEDEYALRIGRLGLGAGAHALGTRATYDQFRHAGCTLDRPAQRSWGGYVYARDTSQVCNEVVMGIYVRGLRHSTLRVCYDPNLI